MGLFVPNKRARHKRFEYEPRFYDPKKEEKLKQRMRVSRLTSKRRSGAGLIYFAILFAMAIYVYLNL
jgi:hypothetical protein